MLNPVFAFLVIAAVLIGAFGGTMDALGPASAAGAKSAVELAIGLIGQMALWLGLMSILEAAGIMGHVARALRPLMTRLFPDVPPDHPAMSAMILNMVANMLGLANAATPFGLKAMVELNRLNDRPGVATDSMALFLAINTSGVAVLPLGVIAVRAQMGATDVAGITIPSILATSCSTVVAILVAKTLAGRARFARERYPASAEPAPEEAAIAGLEAAEAKAAHQQPISKVGAVVAVLALGALIVALGLEIARAEAVDFELFKSLASHWLLPTLMLFIVVVGLARTVRVYEVFIEGAKSGFRIGVLIIPYLVAILVAVGMFRASGALEMLLGVLAPVTSLVGFPPELLPMALIRPLSGSGALGVMMETMKTHGPDSFVGFAVSVLNGSTETTFYVLAVYFGSVGVRAVRHTLLACLAADLTGALAAVAFARLFF